MLFPKFCEYLRFGSAKAPLTSVPSSPPPHGSVCAPQLIAMKRANFGVVFDIDGVLMKSDKAIPEALGALNILHNHPEYVNSA